jgi:hypothetical protein
MQSILAGSRSFRVWYSGEAGALSPASKGRLKLDKVKYRAIKGPPIEGGSMASFGDIIDNIKSNHPMGISGLRDEFAPRVRALLRREVDASYLDGEVEAVLAGVVTVVRSRVSLDPKELPAMVHSVVRERRKQRPKTMSTGTSAEPRSAAAMERMLSELSPVERDALFRFYVLDQLPAEISKATGLTQSQLQEVKARAKARFKEISRDAAST